MALTDIIEADLLATLDGDADPQAVLDRYSSSKGPLYAALARATAKATARFTELRGKVTDAGFRRAKAEKAAEDAEKRAGHAERRLQAAEKRLAEVTAGVEAQQGLLDQAATLRAAGFDEVALAALGRSLGSVAKTEGVAPAEAVARFLEAATDFEGIATFRRQAVDAEERAKKAEADARQRERSAKVRTVAIAWAEWFVKRGIAEKTVAAWQAVGQALGLTAENLGEGLAGALQQFGSLQAVCEAKAKERDGLAAEAEKLKAAVGTLRQERQRIRAALDAVAAEGSNRVALAETQAVAAIRTTGDEYKASIREAGEQMAETIRHFAEVQRDAAELGRFVSWAKALMQRDLDPWRDVEPEQWAAFLWHFARWVEAAGVNPEVPIPDEVKQQGRGSVEYLSLHGQFRVPLLALTAWLAEGLRYVPAAAVLALAANGRERADGRA